MEQVKVLDPHQVVRLQQRPQRLGEPGVYATIRSIRLALDYGALRKAVKDRPQSPVRETVVVEPVVIFRQVHHCGLE